MHKVTIPMRLPSCNEYINACRTNRYMAASLKKRTETELLWYLRKLPKFEKPVTIKFTWVSEPKDRRDLDGICFAKKFILDALQQAGKLSNDNRKHVVGFQDEFIWGANYEVRLEVEEIKIFELDEQETKDAKNT